MTHGSLFSGIGGFDLAAEWMGWENKFHCEINEFCQKVLKYHFPKSIGYADIKKTDFTEWNGKIDVVSGGFPCQPFSVAGKQKGTEDDRYLWKEMLRAIREIQPSWIVGENVPGIVNWSKGMVFNDVQIDLEIEGYKISPILLPACGVGAIHRRERIWFIAYANKKRLSWGINENGFGERTLEKPIKKLFPYKIANSHNDLSKPYNTIRNDGLSKQLDGIAFSNWLIESIKGYGNAIVPQVVYQIFKTIEQYELATDASTSDLQPHG